MLTIAHITEEIASKDQYVEMCHIAEHSNKPMYIIVKEGVNWDKFKKFNWRKIYHYQYDYELQMALNDILNDYKMFKEITCL